MSGSAVVRDFKRGDAARLAKIANESFSDEIRRGLSAFDEGYFVRRSSRPGVRLLVAVVDGTVSGFVLLTAATVEEPAQLHLVAVEEMLRGRGIGRLLVGEAVKLAGEGGAGKLKLSTRPWNATMRAVCSSHGFVEEATLRREFLGADIVRYAYFYK